MVGAHPKPIYLPKNGISKEKKKNTHTNIILFAALQFSQRERMGQCFAS
jgi:hypothetical protein